MWLNQRLGLALSPAAPIGFTNKHLISIPNLTRLSTVAIHGKHMQILRFVKSSAKIHNIQTCTHSP